MASTGCWCSVEMPYIAFYGSDWRGDVKLGECSLAARGLWLELMIVMREATPEGHLYLGTVPVRETDHKRIAKLAGAKDSREAQVCIDELKSMGVYSVDENGAIYSRRLVRDAAKRTRNRLNGRLGGNPRLTNPVKQPDNPESDNPPVKAASDIAKSQASTNTRDTAAADTGGDLRATDSRSPGWQFAEWFVREAVSHGVLGAHHALDASAAGYKQREAADALVAAHGRDECETRARRFFAAKAAGDIRFVASVGALSQVWDWNEITGTRAAPERPNDHFADATIARLPS